MLRIIKIAALVLSVKRKKKKIRISESPVQFNEYPMSRTVYKKKYLIVFVL